MRNSILFITYYFSPIKATGSVRNSKLAKYISRCGANVRVLTTSNSFLFPQEEIIQSSDLPYKTERSLTLDYQTIKLLLQKLSRRIRKKGIRLEPFKNPRQMTLLKIFSLFPLNVLIGEGGALYILFQIIRAAVRVIKNKVAVLYTSYSPFSDIFIGAVLKRLFPRLIWVADFRDLPIYGKKSNFLLKITDRLYCSLLKKADHVTTVSQGLADLMNSWRKKVEVVPNGFDPDDLPPFSRMTKPKSFSFLYVGALYGSRRDPSVLFEVLGDLVLRKEVAKKDLKLVYAGREGDLFMKAADRFGLRQNARDLGFVDRGKALALQRQNYFLVMLTWSDKNEKGIISGKFYEYLNAGRPIICLIQGERDREIEEIFRATGAGQVVYSDQGSRNRLRTYIREYYRRFRTGSAVPAQNKSAVSRFSYSNIAEKLLKLTERSVHV